MTRKLTQFMVIMLMALTVHSCYYDNAEDLYGVTPPVPVEDVSFANDIKPIIETSCYISGCHLDGAGRVPLSTYDEVKLAIDNNSLASRVESGTMPQGRSLSPDEYNKFIAWLDKGAQNN